MNKNDEILILHEWLYQNGGSEKVVSRIIENYDRHPLSLFVLFKRKYRHNEKSKIDSYPIRKSFLHFLPFIQYYYRFIVLFAFDLLKLIKLKKAKIVFSSSHAVIKNIKKPEGSVHICYCHTPMRYIWDLYDDYYAHSNFIVRLFLRSFAGRLRKIDCRSLNNVDYFLANSRFVQERIKKYYQRDSKVIYPPVDDEFFFLNTEKRESYYICIGRLVPYKKIDLIVDTFATLKHLNLIIVGDGYFSNDIIKKINPCSNIKYLGHLSNEDLRSYLQKAKASVFAAKEDFGIGCVESQFCGTPVIALQKGGYLETVTEGLSGYFFSEQTVESLTDAILKMEKDPLNKYSEIHNSVLKFSKKEFDTQLKSYVDKIYAEYFNPAQG